MESYAPLKVRNLRKRKFLISFTYPHNFGNECCTNVIQNVSLPCRGSGQSARAGLLQGLALFTGTLPCKADSMLSCLLRKDSPGKRP